MKNYNDADIKAAKIMIMTIEAGGKVSASHFLPIYNRLTGKREKSNCASCWAVRVKYLKKVVQVIEESKVLANQMAEQVEQAEKIAEGTTKKKGRGRPKKSDK